MINWILLGIEPTKDTAAIKKAYRTALTVTNPEDRAEEFMALRQAYEEAMAWARTPDEDAAEPDASASALERDLLPKDHPAYGWTRKLQALYKDFPRRIQAENWAELVSDPVCTRIDTASDCEEALLHFLMEWWFVPDGVIRALNEVFAFDKNREKLNTRYPAEFMDAILLTPLTRQTGMEYQYYEGAPDADYDGYINLYYTLTGHVNRGEKDQAWQCITAMEELDIYHPYINIEKAKLYLSEGRTELAAAAMEAVWPAYDASPSVCCMAGEVLLAEENFEEAADRFTRALELYPESRWGQIGMAEACLGLKEYGDAEAMVNRVLAADRYSPRGKALEDQIQQAQKEDYSSRLEDGTITPEQRISLAVIHIDHGEFQEAFQLLSSIEMEDRKKEAQRLHYMATAQLDMEDYEEAHHSFRQAETLLRELISVTAEDEEKEKLKENLCRTQVMDSIALENLDRPDEALNAITNAAIDNPQDNMVLCRKAELHYELKQYQEAVDAATASLAIDSSFHLPYRIRANAYYELGYYNEAFRDCNDCIDIYGGDIEAFFCKINILAEVGETDAALQELDSLESQVQGTQITFLRGKTLEAADKLREARDCYFKVLEMTADKEREIFWPAEASSTAGTYFRLFQVLMRLYETEGGNEFWRAAQKYLQEGVKHHPGVLALIRELAGEFYGQSRHKDAQKLYERMVELEPSGRHYAQLAGNELQLDKFTAAAAHLEKSAELDPHLTYGKILLAALHMHTESYEKALEYIDEALACAEANEEVWYRILRDRAMILCRMGRLDEACECYKENYRLYQQQEDLSSALEVLRLSGRFEEAAALGEEYLSSHAPEDSLLVLEELKYTAMFIGNPEAFERYRQMDTRRYTNSYQSGRYYMYRADGYPEAVQHFEDAAQASRNSINTNIDLAKLYLKLKNTRKAYEFAGKVLDAIPEDFMDHGYNRAFYLARSAEALAILGKYEEAMHRLDQAVHGRKCDFCKYPGCIDAYCAYVYICCIRGDGEKMKDYLQTGLQVSPYDYDLANLPDHFMKKKRGFFR